jgi:coenzyme Q-binding protein COQ10
MPEVRHAVDVDASREAAFELVSNVDEYPELIDECSAVHIIERSEGEVVADLALGMGRFRGRFRQAAPEHVYMQLVEGPLGLLEGDWRFTDIGDGRSRIDLAVAYKSSNFAKDALLRPAVDMVCRRLVNSVARQLNRTKSA